MIQKQNRFIGESNGTHPISRIKAYATKVPFIGALRIHKLSSIFLWAFVRFVLTLFLKPVFTV